MKEIPNNSDTPGSPENSAERRLTQQKLELAEGAKPAETPSSKQFEGPPEPTQEQIEQFQQKFGDKAGADHVVGDAKGDNWSKRVGAEHHISVAQELGDQVKSFEDPFHPESTGRMNNVDIVTQDDYAIECKTSWGDHASPSTVSSAYHQADKRLEPNTEDKSYKGVVVVFPDGKFTGSEAAQKAQNYETYNPNIRYCEKSQVKQVLDEMRN